MERASIDELFIDVSDFCYLEPNKQNDTKLDEDIFEDREETDSTIQFVSNIDSESRQSLEETIKCHENMLHQGDLDCELGRALRVGCHIARTVRRAVFDNLGFTLSAGISTSKLVAKLAASYGKPNGQVSCVVYCITLFFLSEYYDLKVFHA